MALKSAVGGKFRVPPVVPSSLMIGFVMSTSFWLFFPQLLRFKSDVRMFVGYAALSACVKSMIAEWIMRCSFNFKVHKFLW